MASTKEYLEFVLEQLSGLDGIKYRAMMGEYIIYDKNKVIGGIYDNRFLIKPAAAAVKMMPEAPFEIPYPGAKGMLLVDNIDSREFLEQLIPAVAAELPASKGKS